MDEIHQFRGGLAFRVGFLRHLVFLKERVVAPRNPQKYPRCVEGVIARFVGVHGYCVARVAGVEVYAGIFQGSESIPKGVQRGDEVRGGGSAGSEVFCVKDAVWRISAK